MSIGFEIETYNQYQLEDRAKHSTCPFCSESRKKKNIKCADLYWDTGLGWCNHCQTRFQLHTYKKKGKEQKKQYVKPTFRNNTKLSDNVVHYFFKRGISQETLNLMQVTEGIEWMPQTGRDENTIQFNYFKDNELINVKFRDGRKNFKMVKDAEKIFYNLDSIKLSDSAIIVEGEADCLSFIEAGFMNCVSVPNGSTLGNVNLDYLDNCIDYFENKEKVYLALDNDEAGQNTTKELIRRLGSHVCFLVDFKDAKDANEYLCRYGIEELKKTIEEAKPVPIDGVTSVLEFREELKDYLLNGMQKGYTIGNKSFDENFSTYLGQYIVVTGIPSSGKSDFVDSMCVGYNRKYGWKIAYASPENQPSKIHAGKLLAKYSGRWVNQAHMLETSWFERGLELLDTNFKFIQMDSYDLEDVLRKAKQMIFRYGIKVLVIDPYNKVRLKASLSKNINEYTNDYLLMIDEFCRKNDVLIILVAHPRKPSGLETKNYEPSFYDIKGGGEFYDMSPHGILVHRDFVNKKVKVKVLKVKFAHLGVTGKSAWYEWNIKNGRYSDFSTQDEDPQMVSGLIEDNENYLVEKGEQVELPMIKPNLDFDNDDDYIPSKFDEFPF
jgi:twinkle protein